MNKNGNRMAVAAVPSEWECRLCLKGFPTKEGVHYGTQSLGMIPAALCENASPEEIGEWIAEQDDNGLSRADLVQGIACAVEHAERRATATKYLAAPSSSAEIARKIAEKIVGRSLAYFVDPDGEPRRSSRAPETTKKIAAIIESELAASPGLPNDPKARANSFKVFLAEQMKDQEFAEAYEEISAKENDLLAQIFAAEREAATPTETPSATYTTTLKLAIEIIKQSLNGDDAVSKLESLIPPLPSPPESRKS